MLLETSSRNQRKVPRPQMRKVIAPMVSNNNQMVTGQKIHRFYLIHFPAANSAKNGTSNSSALCASYQIVPYLPLNVSEPSTVVNTVRERRKGGLLNLVTHHHHTCSNSKLQE